MGRRLGAKNRIRMIIARRSRPTDLTSLGTLTRFVPAMDGDVLALALPL
jgi:hypothetical protein